MTSPHSPIPAGDLVTVPRYATNPMYDAADAAYQRWYGASLASDPALDIWQSMLAASPAHATGAAMRERLYDALDAELSGAFDCTRVWSAWSYGTMREDDFVPVLDRLDEIVDGLLAALSSPAPEGEAAPVRTDADGLQASIASADYAAGYEEGWSRAKAESGPGPAVAGDPWKKAIDTWSIIERYLVREGFDHRDFDGEREQVVMVLCNALGAAALTVSPSPSERDQHQGKTAENLRHTRDLWFNEAARLRKQVEAVRAALSTPEAVPVADKREGGEGQNIQIKALEWEHLGGAFWRAAMPMFGTLRVESYGDGHLVSWSVPGFTSQFIEGRWATADEAKAAAQAEYDCRILSAIAENSRGMTRDDRAQTLREGALRERDDLLERALKDRHHDAPVAAGWLRMHGALRHGERLGLAASLTTEPRS